MHSTTSGDETVKRRWRRPRFSLRTLVILMTLVCAYFAVWQATRIYGVNGVADGSWSPMPFVVAYRTGGTGTVNSDGGVTGVIVWPRREHYYMWLFGPTVKLPFETEWE